MQGDHIKTWRRRWFVLKQGYMFRFATPDVSPSTKPRGLVDLSKVSDVTPAKDATGRNNSLMLSTPTGRVLYVADSETEQVEWLSAIEGAVNKIVRQVPPGTPPRQWLPSQRHVRCLSDPHAALAMEASLLCLKEGTFANCADRADVSFWESLLQKLCNPCADCGRGG